MLCHTQYIHNLTWNEQWSGTASAVCLCPLPTSSVQALGWDWEPPCIESLVHWCALWRRGANPTTAQGILLIPQLAGVCHQSWLCGASGAVKCTTLHLCAANLNPFLVAHSCMAFTACCRCLSMVSMERPRKQIARSSTSALKMSMAITDGSSLIFSPKHVTARTPPVGTLLLDRIHQSVFPIRARILQSLRYSDTKTSRRPRYWRHMVSLVR